MPPRESRRSVGGLYLKCRSVRRPATALHARSVAALHARSVAALHARSAAALHARSAAALQTGWVPGS
jgi:hypothetical protein